MSNQNIEDDCEFVRTFLRKVITDRLGGKVEPLIQAAGILLEISERSELEQKVEKLESIVATLTNRLELLEEAS